MSLTPARARPLKGDASKVYKLFKSGDDGNFMVAMSLVDSVLEGLEVLLDDLHVTQEGKIKSGKRFGGSEKNQHHLNALLMALLASSVSERAQALRDQTKIISITTAAIPQLSVFPNLKEAKLYIGVDCLVENLTCFGSTPFLEYLTLYSQAVPFNSGKKSAQLISLQGLDAPNLLSLTTAGLELLDINGLENCSKLQEVFLQRNQELKDITALSKTAPSLVNLSLAGSSAIENLMPLQKAHNLEFLSISMLEKITDLSALKDCTKLQYINFGNCKALQSFDGLCMETISDKYPGNSMRIYGADEFSLVNLKVLKSLSSLPPVASELTKVKILGLDSLSSLDGLERSQHLQKLVLTKSALQDLSAIAQLTNLKEIECVQCDEITDASVLGELTQLEKVTFTKCQNLEILPSQWKSAVKVLNLLGCPALKPIESLPPGLDKKDIEISDRKLLPREKPVKVLKSDMRSLWKLLSSRDVANIRVGLSLSEALTTAIDDLIADVSIKNGELKRGKRFDGTGPAQPFLDMALFGLMSGAVKGSKLAKSREDIQTLTVSLTTESPDLKGFDNIETLTLLMVDDTAPDLRNFGALPALKTLKINGAVGKLLSLNGLDAPLLEEARLKGVGLVNVEALSKSPLLKNVDLSENKKLSSLEGICASAATLKSLNLQKCESLKSIEHVGNFTQLKELYLADCKSLKSIEALSKIKTLTTLTLENCCALSSLKGINGLTLEMPKSYGGSVLSLSDCSSLATLEYFPKIPDSVDSLDLCSMISLKSLQHLPQLSEVKSLRAYNSGFEDILAIHNIPNLKSAIFSNCSMLKDVQCLGQHTMLKKVTLSSTAIEKLPPQWKAPLEELDISQNSLLVDLGQLPASLGQLNITACNTLSSLKGIEGCAALIKLNANQCDQLTSLKGLQHCTQLEELHISMRVNDHVALTGLKNTQIHIAIPDDFSVFPDEWLASINKLQDSELHLARNSHLFGASTEKTKFDYNHLSLLQNVKTLNFEKWDFQLNYDEMGWLLKMPNLQSLRFTPRGRMAHRIGSGVYDDINKLRKLQKTICTEGGFTRPAFLIAHD